MEVIKLRGSTATVDTPGAALRKPLASVFVAWRPPYTPSTAAKFVREMSDKSPHAKAAEFCRSREGRVVPMLHVQEGRMDVFLDLHNPAPGDPTFFYILPDDLLQEPMIGLRNRFIQLAYARISKIKPLIPMSNKPKVTGANYHPLWR